MAYVVRSALSLKKLVYLDGQKAVLYRSRMNPSLGRNVEILEHLDLSPLEKPPPPDVREVVRVPVDDEGREIAASA